MSLTVEDGTGVVNADSLVSLADADAYFEAMGEDTWGPKPEARREAALRRGTQYVIGQQLRPEAITPVVMQRVKEAVCEAAVRDIAGTLYKDVEAQAVTEKTIDVITTKYSAPSNGGRRSFPVIDDLLKGLTLRGSVPSFTFDRS